MLGELRVCCGEGTGLLRAAGAAEALGSRTRSWGHGGAAPRAGSQPWWSP